MYLGLMLPPVGRNGQQINHDFKAYQDFNQDTSAASFYHQRAAWVPDMLCNFYFVKKSQNCKKNQQQPELEKKWAHIWNHYLKMTLTRQSLVCKCLLMSKMEVYILYKRVWSDQETQSRNEGGGATSSEAAPEYFSAKLRLACCC